MSKTRFVLCLVILSGCQSSVLPPPKGHFKGSFVVQNTGIQMPGIHGNVTDRPPDTSQWVVGTDGTLYASAGGTRPVTFVCHWKDGALKVDETTLPYEVVAAADFDGDGADELFTSSNNVVWGNGAQESFPSQVENMKFRSLARAKPPQVLFGSMTNCQLPPVPSLQMFEWTGTKWDFQLVSQTGSVNPTHLFWGQLFGRNEIVASGSGCRNHPNQTIFFAPVHGGGYAEERPLIEGGEIFWTGDDLIRSTPMGAVTADFNGVGSDSLVITFAPDVVKFDDVSGRLVARQVLTQNRGNLPLLGWAVVSLDLDLDGRLDLCVANGNDWDLWQSVHRDELQWPSCHWNAGEGRFAEVTDDVGLSVVKGQWMALETADVNSDGHMDLLLGGQGQEPQLLLWVNNK